MAEFTPNLLLPFLRAMPVAPVWWLAYSGGLDSEVLLHALATLRPEFSAELRAVHVHHGLHADADAWTEHCRNACDLLDVPLSVLKVDVRARSGDSLEAKAREARHAAIADLMDQDHLLLTAHHRDDQAETLLLQLLRGAGLAGLAAMAPVSAWRKGHLGRPLLGFGRARLLAYAEQTGLTWVNDPSNADTRFDRNYLRHEVLPLIERRWPGYRDTLARSAGHCAEARGLIDEFIEAELPAGRVFSTTELRRLAAPRARALLRGWIGQSGLPMPDARTLQRILSEVVPAGPDAQPLVHWQGAEVRRYRDRLYLLEPLAPVDVSARVPWAAGDRLDLPNQLGWLQQKSGVGLHAIASGFWASGSVEVGYRRGGERFQPAGQGHHRDLKKLLQEAAIPPWVRQRLPLVFIDGVLAAVPGLGVDQAFSARAGDTGVHPRWHPPASLLWSESGTDQEGIL